MLISQVSIYMEQDLELPIHIYQSCLQLLICIKFKVVIHATNLVTYLQIHTKHLLFVTSKISFTLANLD